MNQRHNRVDWGETAFKWRELVKPVVLNPGSAIIMGCSEGLVRSLLGSRIELTPYMDRRIGEKPARIVEVKGGRMEVKGGTGGELTSG